MTEKSITKNIILLIISLFILLTFNCSSDLSKDKYKGGKETGSKKTGEKSIEDSHEEEGEHIVLSKRSIELAGITFGIVGLKQLGRKITFPGEIGFNEERHSRIIPRFPGIAKKIFKSTGDKVKEGDILATVESNESLSNYNIRSGISGTIISRNISLGEFISAETVIFEIADLSKVWVNLSIFAGNSAGIKTGMNVKISSIRNRETDFGIISYLSPVLNNETRNFTARVILQNENNRWNPGSYIRGEIKLQSTSNVPVIFSEAIQFINDEPCIFIPEGDNEFHIAHIIPGKSDGEFTHVLKGIAPGDKYVKTGAFELKAKLVTSAMEGHAGHGH